MGKPLPHRGVRLSLGDCLGEELRCQYHAWRFATGTGQCTHIPAHPTQKPATTIHPAVFPVFEDGTFIWVSLMPDAIPPSGRIAHPGTALRSLFIRAPLRRITGVLLEGYAQQSVNLVDEFTLVVGGSGQDSPRFMLQPVTDDHTILHAALPEAILDDARLSVLRHHNGLMSAVRDRAESIAP